MPIAGVFASCRKSHGWLLTPLGIRSQLHAMLNIALWRGGAVPPFEPPASRASAPRNPVPGLRGGEKSTAPGCPTSRSSESEFVNCCQAEPHETTQAQAKGNQDAHTPCLRSLVSLTLDGAHLRGPYRWPSSIFGLEKSHDKIRSRVEVRDLVMTGDDRPVKQARKYWLGSSQALMTTSSASRFQIRTSWP